MDKTKIEIFEIWSKTCDEWFVDCTEEKKRELLAVVLDFLMKIEIFKPR